MKIKTYSRVREKIKPFYYLMLRLVHSFWYIYNDINQMQAWRKLSKLEIGSGSTRRAGWISSDYRPGCDIMLDVTKKWPFKDGSLDEIYSCHVFEHFDSKSLSFILKEACRVLKPGGIMRISVPDLRIFVRAYQHGVPDRLLKFKPAIISDRPADVLNYIFYMSGEHKIMFDFDSICHHLSKAGFSNIQERQYEPDIDGVGREDESLYVICRKALPPTINR